MPHPKAQTARSAAAAAALLAVEAALLPTPPGPTDSGERSEQLAAAAACLEAQRARASQERARLIEHRGALRAQLAERCREAGAHQDSVAAALQALAERTACLAGSSGGEASPLLGADLPDSYASACQTLLDSLAGYLQHNFLAAESAASTIAAADAQAAALELQQLQSCMVKMEQLCVQEEAELARLQAELGVLQAPPATAGATSLGYSAADLQAEVVSLERRRDATLQAAETQAEAAAAAAAGAEVVRAQAALRRAALERRVHAKQKVAGMLARHLGRQLLVQQLVQHEQAGLQEVQATVAAARQDAELALQVAQARQAGDTASPAEQESQQDKQPPVAAQQQEAQPSDPLATAQQLMACRARLHELAEQTQAQVLPAYRPVLAQLHGLLWQHSSSGSGAGSSAAAAASAAGGQGDGQSLPELELSPPALQQQLSAVAQAEAAVSLQANALLEEVIARQQAPAERQLAETVLCWFWTQPKRLSALAEKQRQQLATYTAA